MLEKAKKFQFYSFQGNIKIVCDGVVKFLLGSLENKLEKSLIFLDVQNCSWFILSLEELENPFLSE